MLNLGNVDTTPGACDEHPFSPPASFTGNDGDYLEFMRRRSRDLCMGQRMAVAARLSQFSTFVLKGPYAQQAQVILKAMAPTGKPCLTRLESSPKSIADTPKQGVLL